MEPTTEQRPLDESDRRRLGRKAERARVALAICVGLAIVVPLAFPVFVCFTPTEFNAGTVTLSLVLCFAAASPFLIMAYGLRRTRKRVERWLHEGHKRCLTGEVTGKGPNFLIKVGEMPVAAWQRSKALSVGDVVTVEYLPLEPGLEGIVGVLRVDGEDNPYLESAWRSGPPTA